MRNVNGSEAINPAYAEQHHIGEQVNRARETGVVRKLKEGFGFIAGNDGQDYFFHWTALQKTSVEFGQLEIGDRVEFQKIEAPKGPRAIEVRYISPNN